MTSSQLNEILEEIEKNFLIFTVKKTGSYLLSDKEKEILKAVSKGGKTTYIPFT